MADLRQVEIAFEAGGGTRIRMSEEQYDDLRRSLSEGSGERWHQIDAPDATVTLDLSKVVFVRLDTEPGRVGF
jgi:hypothetical protein